MQLVMCRVHKKQEHHPINSDVNLNLFFTEGLYLEEPVPYSMFPEYSNGYVSQPLDRILCHFLSMLFGE